MQSRCRKVSRRTFLRNTAAYVIDVSAIGVGHSARARSETRLRLAAVGTNHRGHTGIAACSSEDIVALCDVDEALAAPARKAFPKAKFYRDYRVMLEKERDEIDAVLIAVPDHMHYPIAMAAMELGKHVYVEKPMGQTVEEVRLLTQAAERYGVVTQMGILGHAIEDIRRLCEMIWSGVIGPVREVHVWSSRPDWPQGMAAPLPAEPVPPSLAWDLWLGPAPQRPYNSGYHPKDWRGWWEFGTSALGDMGCHQLDSVHRALKLGPPNSLKGIRQEGCIPQTPQKKRLTNPACRCLLDPGVVEAGALEAEAGAERRHNLQS